VAKDVVEATNAVPPSPTARRRVDEVLGGIEVGAVERAYQI
jgi:hypothetical protein